MTMINMLKVDLVGKMVQNFRRDIETVKRNRDHWIKKYCLKQNLLDEVKIWLVKNRKSELKDRTTVTIDTDKRKK